MRRPRVVCFVVVVAAGCGGGKEDDQQAPSADAATTPGEPLFEGKTFSARCAELESPATSQAAASALARLGTTDARGFAALTKALAHADVSVRAAASAALVRAGEAAVTPTAAALEASVPAARDAAADTLVRMGAPGLRR